MKEKTESMFRMYKITILILVIAVSMACEDYRNIDDFDRSEYKPEFALPLASGEFSFTEFIGEPDQETFLEINEQGIVTFVYNGDVNRQGALNIFDAIQLLPFVAPDSVNLVPIELNNDITVDYAVMSGGSMSIASTNPYSEPILVELGLPELIQNGESYKMTFGPFEAGEAVIIDQDLTGIELNLGRREMKICLVAILQDGSRDKLPEQSFGALRNMTFSYVEGYWAYEEIPMDEDTIEIEVFETLRRGDMYFEEPVVTVNLQNSFGFPVRADVRALELYTLSGDTFPVESPFVTNGFDVNYPLNVGEYESTIFSFTKDNSNLPEVTSIKPLALYYDMYAIANPDRDTSFVGFMTDSSEIIVNVQVKLPLKGRASDFEATDTIAFQIPETGEYGEIEEGELKLYFENNVPVAVQVQGYIWDENQNVIDSLFEDGGIVIEGNDGGEEDYIVSEHYVPFDQDRYNLWKEGEQMFIEARFTSESYPETVEITEEDKLRFGMGIRTILTNL